MKTEFRNLRMLLGAVIMLLAMSLRGAAQQSSSSATASTTQASSAGSSKPNAALESILSRMDATAAAFRTTQANFVWDQFQKVVNESDSQTGKVYFRRQGKDVEMAAEITNPDTKFVIFSDGKVDVYQPKIDQVTRYNAGKDRDAFESFLVLGFGGRGHDLLKSFAVTYQGTETAQGINTVKLQLVPQSQRVHNIFDHIILWIDPTRGVSVQQQFFEPSGDYRLAKYSDIQINQRISDNVFKLKTTSRTKVVTPSGI